MCSLIIRVGLDGTAIMIRFQKSPMGSLTMTDFETTQEILKRSEDDLTERPEGPWGGEPRLDDLVRPDGMIERSIRNNLMESPVVKSFGSIRRGSRLIVVLERSVEDLELY